MKKTTKKPSLTKVKKTTRKPLSINIERAEETKNQIVPIEHKEIVTRDVINNYLKSFGFASLSETERSQFIEIATAFQLNPFKREIYCVPYNTAEGRKLSIITGYEVYLKRASRLNVLDGWNVKIEGTGDTAKAIITIHRKDWSQPFTHEVLMREYNTHKSLWNSKPETMLKKVCTAQGFRLAFPDEFGGMPYTSDELPDEMTTPRIVNETVMQETAEKTDIINEINIETEKQKDKLTDKQKEYIQNTVANKNASVLVLKKLLDKIKEAGGNENEKN